MAEAFGGLTIPVPVDAPPSALTDPSLEVFGDFFKTVLETWAGAAWVAAFPGEEVVRTLKLHDPEQADFTERECPALYVWRQSAGGNKETDGHHASRASLILEWVFPERMGQDGRARRSGFLNGFEKVIRRAVELGRLPEWVHASDAALAPTDPIFIATSHYGSQVRRHVGISNWELLDVEETTFAVQVADDGVLRYPALMATITLYELSKSDASLFGVAPTQVDFTLQTEGPSPRTLQHEREPNTP